ncbi:MAG: hypothetical protein ACRD2I_00475 [Vicinamibacterales bacterium]
MKTLRRICGGIPRSLIVLIALLAIASNAFSQTEPRDGVPREGITVHGHWVIDVRNADGSLSSHMEFENRLALPGDEPFGGAGNRILAALLGRSSSAGIWEIQLHGVNVDLCQDLTAPVVNGCVITEPLAATVAANYFKNLTMTTDLQAGTVTLKGTARANSCAACGPLPVTHVNTVIRTCAAASAPSAPCTANQAGGVFTKTEVPDPKPLVTFNQSVDVTVVISFS